MTCSICKNPNVEVHESGMCDSCETQDAYDRAAERDAMTVGTRVKLTHDVDRFPHFIADAGMTGTVSNTDDGVICVKMDEHLAGAEEWGNEIVWSIRDGDRIEDAVEVLS